jgi:NAD(P)-dependent dehydrogenase (short-subunit alcohol dehydrogenase family)
MMRSLEEQIAPGEPEKAKQGFMQNIGLQRYATPQEIAQMMLFLASDESSYCTGGVYMVDGGMTKRR